MEKQIIDSNAEKILSPEWFTIEAKKYANVDIETKPLYEEFRKKFGPEVLKNLEGLDLLYKMFINETAPRDNLCYFLEFDGGFYVRSDCSLIESHNLKLEESSLT